jgi:ribonuclease P/MRP protein subunit RPP40
MTTWAVVEINLRLPSMLHGKKGFDRIVYAFKNVLNTPVTWLFHDLNATGSSSWYY